MVKMDAFSLRLRTSQGYLFSKVLSSIIVLKDLARAIRQEEELIGTHFVKVAKLKLSLFIDDIIICVENLIKKLKNYWNK